MKNKIIVSLLAVTVVVAMMSNVLIANTNWLSGNPDDNVTKAELNKVITKLLTQVDQEQKIINTVANSLPLIVRITGSTVTEFPAEDGKPYRWMVDPIVSMGSGVFINDNTVLTNAHVILGRNQFRIETYGGEKYWAELIKSDEHLDLALLKLKTDKSFKSIELANNVVRGQTSIVIGHATADSGDTELGWGVTRGVVSNPKADVSWYEDRLQIDNPINAGNSGTAVIDISGRMIGLVVASANDKEDIGYAIRVEDVRGFLESK